MLGLGLVLVLVQTRLLQERWLGRRVEASGVVCGGGGGQGVRRRASESVQGPHVGGRCCRLHDVCVCVRARVCVWLTGVMGRMSVRVRACVCACMRTCVCLPDMNVVGGDWVLCVAAG